MWHTVNSVSTIYIPATRLSRKNIEQFCFISNTPTPANSFMFCWVSQSRRTSHTTTYVPSLLSIRNCTSEEQWYMVTYPHGHTMATHTLTQVMPQQLGHIPIVYLFAYGTCYLSSYSPWLQILSAEPTLHIGQWPCHIYNLKQIMEAETHTWFGLLVAGALLSRQIRPYFSCTGTNC